MKVAAVVANNYTNTVGRLFLTYFSVEPTFLHRKPSGKLLCYCWVQWKMHSCHIIQYYMHLGPDPKPADINGTAAIKTRKDWGLGSHRQVFPSIKLYRKLSTNEQQHWRGCCLEGNIKCSELLTLKTVVWFRFASQCLPKESYEHSLILIIPSNSHVFIRMLFWSCLGEIFGPTPKTAT